MKDQTKTDRKPGRRAAARVVDTSGGGAVVGNPNPGGDPGSLGIDLETMRGRVSGYTVGGNGLIVHLDVAAHIRIAFHVGPDEPHFRTATSMAMVALNNRVNPATSSGAPVDQQYLWVSLDPATANRNLRRATKVGMSVSNDKDPFDLDGWVTT